MGNANSSEGKRRRNAFSVGFSCVDCCSGGERIKKGEGVFTPEEITVILKNNQTGITILVIFQLILLGVWAGFTFVPGFSVYDGQPGTAHPISHFGFWFIADLIVFAVGIVSVYFSLHVNERQGLEFHVGKARDYLIFYLCILVIGMCSNIVHFALTIVEAVHCTSSFCRGFNVIDPANALSLGQPPVVSAWLIMLVVLLAVNIFVLQLVLVFRVYIYRIHLLATLKVRSSEVFDVPLPNEAPPTVDEEGDLESVGVPFPISRSMQIRGYGGRKQK